MTYFFDNCISWRLVDALKALNVPAEHLRDTLAQNTDDVEIFKLLEGRDIVFVASDLKQLSREAEARELKKLGCTAIYFVNFYSKMELWPQATWLVKQWPTIEGFVEGTARGTIAEIQQNGKARPTHL